MERTTWPAPGDTTERRLERELTEVAAAIQLVASGVASRVEIAGIRFGQLLAERMRDEATEHGVRLDPEPWPEDAGCDLLVQRLRG